LAGTAHLSRNKDSSFPASPTESEVEQFVSALKQAVPAFSWSSSLIRKVYWGVLPVKRESTVDLTVRPEIVPHGKEAVGLYSVVGIKFTTAMQVATTALQMIFGSALPQTLVDKEDNSGPALSKFTAALLDGDRAIELSRSELLQIIRTVAKDEAVFETDDLFLRRTNWLFTAKEPQLLRALVDEALLQISRFTPAPMSQTQNTSGVH
jgi:hypothetical protein